MHRAQIPLLFLVFCTIPVAAASTAGVKTLSPTAVPLPTDLAIDPRGISISGLSSGADFTVQFQVAFSSVIMGSGVFAGQPYHCAVTRFTHDPMKPPNPSVPICEECPANKTLNYDHCKNWAWTGRGESFVEVDRLVSYAQNQSSAGTIDDVKHLRDARVYLYRGTKDVTYLKGSVDNNRLFFAQFVADPEGQIQLQNTTPSAHSWPTVNYGTPCGKGVIEACDYDGPGAALQHIYAGALRPPSSSFDTASLFEYDQGPFFGDHARTGLNNSGWIYVPKACRNASGAVHGTDEAKGVGACKLHLSLHGCGVNEYYDPAVHHLGFENWAESNGIVIMFPRMAQHGTTTQTKSGCWDAYAQSGADYSLRKGAQMAAVRDMIRAVARV